MQIRTTIDASNTVCRTIVSFACPKKSTENSLKKVAFLDKVNKRNSAYIMVENRRMEKGLGRNAQALISKAR